MMTCTGTALQQTQPVGIISDEMMQFPCFSRERRMFFCGLCSVKEKTIESPVWSISCACCCIHVSNSCCLGSACCCSLFCSPANVMSNWCCMARPGQTFSLGVSSCPESGRPPCFLFFSTPVLAAEISLLCLVAHNMRRFTRFSALV